MKIQQMPTPAEFRLHGKWDVAIRGRSVLIWAHAFDGWDAHYHGTCVATVASGPDARVGDLRGALALAMPTLERIARFIVCGQTEEASTWGRWVERDIVRHMEAQCARRRARAAVLR